MAALGHAVRVFGPASKPLGNGETALARSQTVTFGGTASAATFDPRVFTAVRAVFAAESFDVVHVHEPLMPLLPWAAVWAATAPIVATFHVHRESGHRWYPLARPLLHTIIARVDARIAVSNAARETVAAVFPGHYEVIPNGIERARFRAPQPRPPEFPAAPVVLCVGRLEPRKGVDVLIDAMARLQATAAGATLMVVGDGRNYDALADRARRCNVQARFIRDVADDRLPAFYQHADVVCAPATGGESFGIVLIEALAAGAPVVASRIDGYVATVGESRCVPWAIAGDAADLARQLLAQMALPKAPIAAAAASIAAGYDWCLVAQRLVDVYRRVQRLPAAVHT